MVYLREYTRLFNAVEYRLIIDGDGANTDFPSPDNRVENTGLPSDTSPGRP